MILLDLNQVMISNMMMSIGKQDTDVNENLLRHMILNSIRLLRLKFKEEYGELVICCDDTNYWRKQHFPYYKANRKKYRQKSHLNWDNIFKCLNKIRDELKDYFPYRVIQVDSAEADDVIATLCNVHGTPLAGDPILIISGDKDFQQLQIYGNVSQYDPTRKRWLKCKNPKEFLFEHILRGDTGDGIPNWLSPDKTFVDLDCRQTPVTAKKFTPVMDGYRQGVSPKDLMEEKYYRNFVRNQKMIDLIHQIPPDISAEAMNQFNTQANKTRAKLFNYFIKNNLKNLMESLSEF